MPTKSKVHKVYKALCDDGMPKGKAAAIAQAKTGQALSTGRKAKTHDEKPTPKTKRKK